jgi:CBS domain-containing protein
MAKTVRDIAIPLSDYAVVGDEATVLEALKALQASQERVSPDRQPHRGILVRDRTGRIVGKLNHFAFLRALVPDRQVLGDAAYLDRAGVGDDLRQSSMQMLDLLTGDLVNLCERARSALVKDVFTPTTVSIDEGATLHEAIARFLEHQTLSLLVTRGGDTVGLLRLSDLFEEVAGQIIRGDCTT